MRLTPTFRTVASGCIALSALFLAQTAFSGGTPSVTQVRADGLSAVTAPDANPAHTQAGRNGEDDVTWGS